ncbi:MAG: response regulator [Arachidicoccus sp.]|nr:response regulator [Arachidicoccus sp.]
MGNSANEMQGARYLRELIPFWLNDTAPHLLTIRYSNFEEIYPDFIGFEAYIGNFDSLSETVNRNKNLRSFLPMSAAAQWILAILHLLLFFYYPRQRLNLYFAAFAIIMGIVSMTAYLFYETHSPVIQYYAEHISNECLPLLLWLGGLVLYSTGYERIPRWKKIVLTIASCFYFIEFLFMAIRREHYWDHQYYFVVVFLLFSCDELRVVIRAIYKGNSRIWIIGLGVLVVIFVTCFAWIDIFDFWTSQLNSVRLFVISAGGLIFPICISIYLALDFAKINKHLAEKLKEVEMLSAHALTQEAEKRELLQEEARKLEETVQLRTLEIQQQADKLKELDLVKSRFFINIAHEFKTPLTLIHNPAEQLLSSDNSEVKYHATLIKNHSEKLLQLINQLLELSKLKSSLLEVNIGPMNLIAMLQEMLQMYAPEARKKNIQLYLFSDNDELWLNSDKDKLEKIFVNLLSNAFKFTRKGKIEILLIEEENIFTVTIKDTGIGIPESKIKYIFDRFYQADATEVRFAEGTGIGLALTKELVSLLKGTISVESKEGLYTEFKVRLPLIRTVPQSLDTISIIPHQVLKDDVPLSENAIQEKITEEKPSLLIIEDNDALREFIVRTLQKRFHVLEACNGKEGIRYAQENVPDIILTDIMMPGTDGYEVCSILKSDEITSHIPVIMLTAKAGTENRIEGIEKGADAYVEKPFVHRELEALINNLIKTRSMLQAKYQKSIGNNMSVYNLPSLEQRFIDRIGVIIQNHLDDELFGADQLAILIGMSRTQLHRKLKGLLGKSPGEFIRTLRLEHAHQLLKKRVAIVSEVAYMVGFASPAAFSVSFSRHFGYPPSEIARQENL